MRLFDDLWMARVDEIQDLCCDTCEPNKAGAPVNAHKCKGSEQRSNWWGKGFDTLARQGDIDNVNGYRSNAFGVMLAYDVPLNNETRAGLGGGYANTTIDGNNSTGRTRVDERSTAIELGVLGVAWMSYAVRSTAAAAACDSDGAWT